MNRLTDNAISDIAIAKFNNGFARKIYNRLREYEGTGLEPEEVTDLQRAWDMYGGELGITEILLENRELKEKQTPKCYSADADGGCRYLVPDGDDEPIDRCKRCPLCYVDKQRHQQTPNLPLTLEELREMDGEPVYIHWIRRGWQMDGEWAFVNLKLQACKTESGAVFFDRYGEWWIAYRRKPEEGTT